MRYKKSLTFAIQVSTSLLARPWKMGGSLGLIPILNVDEDPLIPCDCGFPNYRDCHYYYSHYHHCQEKLIQMTPCDPMTIVVVQNLCLSQNEAFPLHVHHDIQNQQKNLRIQQGQIMQLYFHWVFPTMWVWRFRQLHFPYPL